MSQEARLERAESGLVPVTDGWFVLNVRDAAWLSNAGFFGRSASASTMPKMPRNSPTMLQATGLRPLRPAIWPVPIVKKAVKVSARRTGNMTRLSARSRASGIPRGRGLYR